MNHPALTLGWALYTLNITFTFMYYVLCTMIIHNVSLKLLGHTGFAIHIYSQYL